MKRHRRSQVRKRTVCNTREPTGSGRNTLPDSSLSLRGKKPPTPQSPNPAILAVLTDIEEKLASALMDLNVQSARLTIVHDFLKVSVQRETTMTDQGATYIV